jgi:DNA-binding MarR family transcriptional regulator
MSMEDSFIALSFMLSAMIIKYKKKRLKAEYGKLTISQYSYLRAIQYLGQPTLSELATVLHLSRPSVSIAILKLSEAGFVATVGSDQDRRSSIVRLTEQGKKVALIEHGAYRDYLRRLSKALSAPERGVFESLMAKAVATAFQCAGIEESGDKAQWLRALE